MLSLWRFHHHPLQAAQNQSLNIGWLFKINFPAKHLNPSILQPGQSFKTLSLWFAINLLKGKKLWSISIHPKMRRGSMRKMWKFTGILKVCPEIPGVARLMIFDNFFPTPRTRGLIEERTPGLGSQRISYDRPQSTSYRSTKNHLST